jgi:E3 ubiquitin-protein ligase MARCH6
VAEKPLDEIIKWSSSSAPAASRDRDSLGNGWIQSTFVDLAESQLARLGQEAKLRAANLQATWTRLALGNGPVERTFAVALGYAVLALLLSLYLNLLTVGSFKSAGKAVRNAVRQQLLIVKVCLR